MATKTWTKTKPSTKAHEVIRTGGRYAQVVFVGSRQRCNLYWVNLPDDERQYHRVQAVTDTKW